MCVAASGDQLGNKVAMYVHNYFFKSSLLTTALLATTFPTVPDLTNPFPPLSVPQQGSPARGPWCRADGLDVSGQVEDQHLLLAHGGERGGRQAALQDARQPREEQGPARRASAPRGPTTQGLPQCASQCASQGTGASCGGRGCQGSAALRECLGQ